MAHHTDQLRPVPGIPAGRSGNPPTLPPLPSLPEPASAVTGLAMIALPVASGAGALVVALGRPGSAMAIGSLVVLVASIAVGVLLFVGQRQGTAARISRQRRRYLDAVHTVDTRLCQEASRRRATGRPAAAVGPPVGDTGAVAVRLGVVTAAVAVPAPAPAADGLVETDPVCAAAVTDLRTRRGLMHELPVDIPLPALRRLVVSGSEESADALLRRLVLDVAGTLPPERLAIVVTGTSAEPWVRWLPHCTRGIVLNRPGRVLRADLADPVDDPWPDLLAAAHLQAILHLELGPGPRSGQPGWFGPTPTARDDPRVLTWRTGKAVGDDGSGDVTRVVVGPDQTISVHLAGAPVLDGRTSALSTDRARMLARDIARRSTLGPMDVPGQAVAGPAVESPTPHPAGRVDGPHFLRAIVGRRSDGRLVELDLKDAAQEGMGPHGLVVGATGSGKSELLRTLVLRLTETHDPDDVVLMLVDYKGGSTFAPFARLPHVAGVLTNLAADQHLPERFAAALRGESARRQAVLARAGVSDVAAFRQMSAPPERLPTMLIVVDEYTELLAAHAELAELFTSLGRVGRSLGMHLLVATQRLDPGRSRGVDAHLSYTIALRTFTAAESQELLGSTAAFTLPRTPGEALLVAAGEAPVRFRVDRCTASTPTTEAAQLPPPAVTGPRPFPETTEIRGRLTRLTSLLTDPEAAEPEVAPDPDPVATAVSAVVDRLIGHPRGARARPVWLDPLPGRIALDALPPAPHCARSDPPTLRLGLVDRPAAQEQTTLTWTPVHHPNLVVSGTGRSGRSTALLTVIAAAAVDGVPGRNQVFGVALRGPTLLAARSWPHVAGIAGADDPDFAERLLRLVTDELDRRERPLGTAAPAAGGEGHPLLLLVVDDWMPSGALDGETDRLIADIAARGPAVGIATAVATAAGTVLRGRLAAAFGTRIELRSTDAFESAIDRRMAATLPADTPGRALVVGGIAQLALAPDPAGAEPDVIEVHRRWAGRTTRRRCPLPGLVRLEHLWPGEIPNTGGDPADSGPDGSQLDIVLGVEEADGPAVTHRLGRPDAHLSVLGDSGSGRTTVLRSIAVQLALAGPPAVLVAIDPRGDLTASGPGPEVAWSATARRTEQIGPLVADILRYLAAQDPIAAEHGGARQRPTGRAPVVVLVDDEELLPGMSHPLAPLLTAARSGLDLGLHLVVARGSGGFGRARFEPLHQMLSDLGTPTLLLSASPEEGRLTHRLLPRPLPPGRAQWAVRGRPRRLLQTPLADGLDGTRIATRPEGGPTATGSGSTVQ